MIAIIDYDAGNLKSVEKAFAALGQESVVTGDRREILAADRVDRKSTRLNSSHIATSRMPSSA